MTGSEFLRAPFAPRRADRCFCASGRRFRDCCGSLAPDRPPPAGVRVVSDWLDRATRAEWLAGLADQPRRPLGVIDATAQGRLRGRLDAARVTDELRAGPLRTAINEAVGRAFSTVIAEACLREFEWYERPQVLAYGAGGHYEAHADSEVFLPQQGLWARNIDRDISLLLYLDEGFTGGELEFVNFAWRHRPRAGDLLYFPSDSRYAHRALPVRSGHRHVVVSWAAFADEPRVQAEPTPGSIPL